MPNWKIIQGAKRKEKNQEVPKIKSEVSFSYPVVHNVMFDRDKKNVKIEYNLSAIHHEDRKLRPI